MSRSSRDPPKRVSLLIRNLPLDVRAEDVRAKFERYGEVRDIYLPKDYYTNKPRGFGFIEFKDSRDAEDALYHLDRSTFMGREISVVMSKESRKTPRDMIQRERVYGGGGGGGGYRGGGGGYGRDSYRDRDRYRDRSPRRHSRSRSPRGRGGYDDRRRSRSRSRSPRRYRDYSKSRSRSPRRDRDESPPRGDYNERDGSPGADRGSPGADRGRSRSRSPERSPPPANDGSDRDDGYARREDDPPADDY